MQTCECVPTQTDPEPKPLTHSLDFPRLALAAETAQRNMQGCFKDSVPPVHETKSHSFERGFCVGAVGSDGKNISLAVSSVVDLVPYDFILSWDLSFFNEDASNSESDILWIDFDLLGPAKKNVRIPLRAVGIIRDVDTGRIASVNTFELATDLIDWAGPGQIILCILGCIGLFCSIACSVPCGAAPLACAICVLGCIGSSAPQVAICITACTNI